LAQWRFHVSTMWIANARLREQEGIWDVCIEGGVFKSIQPSTGDRTADYNAQGRLLCSPFVEGHIHLDYAHTARKPRPNVSGTLFEAIEIWAERKQAGLNNPAEIRRNALSAIRAAVSHGVGFIRSHVDVTDPELVALKTMLRVREEVKTWCTVQLVAFPQNGIEAFPRGRQLMDEAMRLGADVVGGIPHLEHTREDGVASVRYVFDLAEKYGALIDIHCDEIDDDQSRFLEVMAAETLRRHMQGRVTVSHAVAMAYYQPGYMAKLLPKLRAAGLGFIINPNENLQLQGRGIHAPQPRGVAPVRTLAEWCLPVGFGQDSIEDPWYPLGDGNPIRNLDTGLHVAQMLTEEYLNRCLDFVTIEPARNLGLSSEYGIEVGKPAHCIVLDATSDREVVQQHPLVLLNLHGGQKILERQPSVTTWAIDVSGHGPSL